MPEIERLRRRTASISTQPLTKGYGPSRAEIRIRNSNKSSLYDVIQNRHRTEVLCKLVFLRTTSHPLNTIWWSRTGSNRRPPACKAGALPAELRPLEGDEMVGLGGLEPPTSRLSSARSNQLSYKPVQSTRRRPAPRGEASQGRPTVGAPAPPTLKPWPDRAAHAGASIIHEEREPKAAGAALVQGDVKSDSLASCSSETRKGAACKADCP